MIILVWKYVHFWAVYLLLRVGACQFHPLYQDFFQHHRISCVGSIEGVDNGACEWDGTDEHVSYDSSHHEASVLRSKAVRDLAGSGDHSLGYGKIDEVSDPGDLISTRFLQKDRQGANLLRSTERQNRTQAEAHFDPDEAASSVHKLGSSLHLLEDLGIFLRNAEEFDVILFVLAPLLCLDLASVIDSLVSVTVVHNFIVIERMIFWLFNHQHEDTDSTAGIDLP